MSAIALFDLDGTLTDPIPALISCHRWALEQVELDFDKLIDERSESDLAELVRLPVAEVHKSLDVPEAVASRAANIFRERRPIAGFLEDQLYPGVADLLADLGKKGWRLGVATNQFEPVVERTLERLGIADLFEIVVGSDVARTRVIKTRVLSHVESNLEDPPEGFVVVADRGSDMEAARELEMTSIGAAWGFGSIDELIAANADAVAIKPSDVSELLVDP